MSGLRTVVIVAAIASSLRHCSSNLFLRTSEEASAVYYVFFDYHESDRGPMDQ